MGRYRIIDTDTHLIEPADLWTERLPKSWGNDVLHVRWDEDAKADMWFFGEEPVKAAWQWANWGWGGDKEVHDGSGPTRREEAHPATIDPKERIRVMDQLGIELQVLYPNLAGFDWHPFVHHPNSELAAAHLSAYNDFQLEWVKQYPGRFIPMIVVPYWDVPRAVREIERLAGQGFGGIVTTGAPDQHGQPPLSNHKWNPMWAACEEAGLSVSFHSASGDFRSQWSIKEGDEIDGGARVARDGPHLYLENGKHTCNLLLSGILPRFPTLQFVSVESGMGWVPFVLEALDSRFVHNHVAKSHPVFGDMLPSDYFHRQMSVNFWFEKLEQFHIEKVGLKNLLFETDFPHPTGFRWPTVEDAVEHCFAGISEDIRHEILWKNPARLYENALKQQGVDLALPVPA